MDKRYLAGMADAVILLVIMTIGLLTAPKLGSSGLKIGGHALIVVFVISVYYFYIGNKLYKKFGWLEA